GSDAAATRVRSRNSADQIRVSLWRLGTLSLFNEQIDIFRQFHLESWRESGPSNKGVLCQLPQNAHTQWLKLPGSSTMRCASRTQVPSDLICMVPCSASSLRFRRWDLIRFKMSFSSNSRLAGLDISEARVVPNSSNIKLVGRAVRLHRAIFCRDRPARFSSIARHLLRKRSRLDAGSTTMPMHGVFFSRAPPTLLII